MTSSLNLWAHVDAYVANDVQRYLNGSWKPLRLDLYPERHRAPVKAYNETLPRAIQMMKHPDGRNKGERKRCKEDGKELLEQCGQVLHDAVMIMVKHGSFRKGDQIR